MSTYLQVKNRAASSLAADITSTATSLTVQTGDGAKFPQPGNGFNITIEDEILKCTARSTDTLTVTRAQEGTTAAAHTAGKSVELRITAGVVESRTTWTVNKLLKGAGIGVDPTEIDVPAAPTVVRKTADETVNNSITLQNDDHLFFALGANEAWLVQLFIMGITPTRSPDLKIGFSVPTGCSMTWAICASGYSTASYSWGYASAVGYPYIYNETGTAIVGFEANTKAGFYFIAIVKNGATAGNLNLQWAQNTATVEDTKVLANSCLIAHKIG